MVKEPKSFHANFYQTHSLIHVQNTFLMKDTYLLLGNYVKFYEKFFFQDVVIYTADNRNVHCVTEVHLCCLHYLNVSFLLFLVYTWMHINSFMNYCQLWTYCISSSIIASFALQVTEGERLTLTLWFTRDRAYNEDPKLLTFLSQTSLSCEPTEQKSYIPMPASDNMYWFSYDQCGFDIRCARVHVLGFSFHSSSDEYSTSVLPAEMTQ